MKNVLCGDNKTLTHCLYKNSMCEEIRCIIYQDLAKR
jgi:hypothetical protein